MPRVDFRGKSKHNFLVINKSRFTPQTVTTLDEQEPTKIHVKHVKVLAPKTEYKTLTGTRELEIQYNIIYNSY